MGRLVTDTPRISRLEVARVRLPLRHTVRMAGRTFDVADNVVICATGDDECGWGEATSALGTTGEDPAALAARLSSLADTVTLPVSLASLEEQAARLLAEAPAARSAVMTALGDLDARTQRRPLRALWGGTAVEASVPLALIVSGATVADEVLAAEAAWGSGYRSLKVKVARRPIEAEAELVATIRSRLPGRELILGADANEGFDFAFAVTFGLETDGLLDYIEQPLPRADLAGLARLRQRVRTPIFVDEGVGGVRDVEDHVAAAAADGVVLKMQKAGSPTALIAAANLARRHGLRVAFTGKVAETSIASAALANVAAAVRSTELGVSVTSVFLAVDPVHGALAPQAGRLTLPPSPGLGVTIDRDVLERYRVDLRSGS